MPKAAGSELTATEFYVYDVGIRKRGSTSHVRRETFVAFNASGDSPPSNTVALTL